MKITAVKGIPLRCACPKISDALSTSTSRQALLVRVETDSELFGIGEAFTYGCPLYIMKYLVEELFGPMLIGCNPAELEQLWNRMYWRTVAHGRRSVEMGAISGIDIALWDLFGKTVGMPVYKLLGAHSEQVPAYASGGFYAPGKGIDGLKREIEEYLEKGYQSVKIKIGRNPERNRNPLRYMADQENGVTLEEDFRRMEAAHELLGTKRLVVDTNASWDSGMVISCADTLRDLGVCWIEEPIPFEDLEGLKKISREAGSLQIAGFETEQGLRNFEKYIRNDAVDILQPDVGWSGGFTECRKIGALAAASGLPVSLHSFGSAVHFAASLHLAAAMPNTEMLESEENPNPLKTDLLKNYFLSDGAMNFFVPSGPGLGIELDWDMIENLTIRI